MKHRQPFRTSGITMHCGMEYGRTIFYGPRTSWKYPHRSVRALFTFYFLVVFMPEMCTFMFIPTPILTSASCDRSRVGCDKCIRARPVTVPARALIKCADDVADDVAHDVCWSRALMTLLMTSLIKRCVWRSWGVTQFGSNDVWLGRLKSLGMAYNGNTYSTLNNARRYSISNYSR